MAKASGCWFEFCHDTCVLEQDTRLIASHPGVNGWVPISVFPNDPARAMIEGSDPTSVLKQIVDASTLEPDLTLIPFAPVPVKWKFHTARVKGQLNKVIDYSHTHVHTRFIFQLACPRLQKENKKSKTKHPHKKTTTVSIINLRTC